MYKELRICTPRQSILRADACAALKDKEACAVGRYEDPPQSERGETDAFAYPRYGSVHGEP